jgi:hypothetical protein
MKGLKSLGVLVLLGTLIPVTILAQETQTPRAGNHTRMFVWKDLEGRGYLGIQFLPMTPELRRHFGVAEDAGVLVSRVEEGSPAEAAGVLVGDILTAVDGERVSGPDLYRIIARKKQGDLVTLELWREGAPSTVDVTIVERERHAMDLARYRFMAPLPNLDIPDDAVYLSGPDFHLDPESMEALGDAMRALSDRKGELREKLQRLDELDLDAIQNRMQEVEQRLQMLERELEKEGVKKER